MTPDRPAPLAPPVDWLPAYEPQKNGVADERRACPWCFVVYRGDHDCRFKPATCRPGGK